MRRCRGGLRFGFLLGGMALLWLSAPIAASAQYWLAGDALSGGGIVHETVLAPPDSSRTEIGIGEPVNLSICSCYDMDIYVDDLGIQDQREDSVGLIEWYLEGAGTL